MISFKQVTLQFGERKLFDDVSFQVNPKDRIGLVGKNGAGKSTLLKGLVGKVHFDSGSAIVPGDTTLGYLPQELHCTDTQSVV